MRSPTMWRERGFTLVEMCVSVAVTSLIIVAIGSSLLVVSKAVPSDDDPPQAALRAAAGAERLSCDLQYATTILSYGPDHVEFLVPDRNGDGVSENVRYGYSNGVLSLRYMGQWETLVSNLREFALDYDAETTTEAAPQTSESGETLLAWNETVVALKDYPIRNDRYGAQFFQPNLPADAVSWRVTRVKLLAKTGGAAEGVSKVQLVRPTPGHLPGATVFAEGTLMESSLTDQYLWREFSFPDLADLSPQEGLCLVIRHVFDTESCRVCCRDGDSDNTTAVFLESTDQGVSWAPKSGWDMLFYVYGKVTTAGTTGVATTARLERVTVTMQAADQPATAVRNSVVLLNRPEVVIP